MTFDDDELHDYDLVMPPAPHESVSLIDAGPHASVGLDRISEPVVVTCKCGASTTVSKSHDVDGQARLWWDAHRDAAIEYPHLEVDREADAAYVELRQSSGLVSRTVELGHGINVDLDGDGAPLGYEILGLHS